MIILKKESSECAFMTRHVKLSTKSDLEKSEYVKMFSGISERRKWTLF